GDEAVCAGRAGVVAGVHAGLRPGGAAIGVDLHRGHRGQVEHDPAVGGAVSRVAVATAADRALGSRLTRRADHSRDVRRLGGALYRRGRAVEAGEEHAARVVVAAVAWADYLAVEFRPKAGDRDIDRGRHQYSLAGGTATTRRRARM